MDKSDLILAAIERMYADVVVIKTDVAELKADVSVLKADVAELKGDMVEVKGDISGLKVRMDCLESGQSEIKKVIGSNHLQVLGRINQLSDQFVNHIRHHA
jgi:SMC interacting uncharacterized protein involved in chromosome segregation